MSSSPTTTDDGESIVSANKSAREIAADAYVQPKLSNLHRFSMLGLFCAASFLDSLFASCLFPALDDIQQRFHLKPTEISWTFGAYSATFSAFLLISGRLSDVYNSSEYFLRFQLPCLASARILERLHRRHLGSWRSGLHIIKFHINDAYYLQECAFSLARYSWALFHLVAASRIQKSVSSFSEPSLVRIFSID